MKWKFWKSRSIPVLCAEVQSQISSLILEISNPERSGQLVRHIDGCEACRKELDTWWVMHDLAKAGKTPLPGGDFWELYKKEVMQSIDELEHIRHVQPQSVRSWIDGKRRPAYALIFVAAVAGIAVLSSLRNDRNSDTQFALVDQENLIEYCIDEFDAVAGEETIVEPLPVNVPDTK